MCKNNDTIKVERGIVMCTAVSFVSKDHYFGRNLDLDRSYGECVVITPRQFVFEMRHLEALKTHYALIGMAVVADETPLYYEATNEKGLSMAGLNFPGNAVYKAYDASKDNVAPFEFIPWILGQCEDVQQAKRLLVKMNLVNTNFSDKLPLTPLHWIISDSKTSLTVESVKDGLKIYDNPWGVLTNNPTFDYHLINMHQYMGLKEANEVNTLNPEIELNNISLGFGALGLPGDYSSISRFVRAAYVKSKSFFGNSEKENVSQFFHILNAVAMPKGCVQCPNGEFEYTRYSCCCNTKTGIYTYTTYNNSTKNSVDLHSVNLNASELICYELIE